MIRRALALAAPVLLLAGCATMPGWISASGPSRAQVQKDHDSGRIPGIRLVDVQDDLARRLAQAKRLDDFAQVFPAAAPAEPVVGPGDVIEVTIWEAPPALLFAGQADPLAGAGTAHPVTFPPQMIALDGMITMPFAGRVQVAGLTAHGIEQAVVKQFTGKTNQPQALVRIVANNTARVTVVGEVASSTMMPLTPRGERLLDALAAASGVKSELSRTAVRVTRAGTVATMPLDLVIRDPQQNIPLRPGDVVTALYQSQRFSVLGATGRNEEIPFEAQGISLAQALARSGGLNDSRADARAVFVFRFEDARLVEETPGAASPAAGGSVEGTVPVVYQVDLRDPASLFVAQHFPVQDRDVLYVANSPEAEVSKFLGLVVSVASPAMTGYRFRESVIDP